MSQEYPKTRLKIQVPKLRDIFSVKPKTVQSISLKGVGRYCSFCGDRIYGRSDKLTCTTRCRKRKYYLNHNDLEKFSTSLKCRIQLSKSSSNKKEYRILTLYMGNSVTNHIRIIPEYTQLWKALNRIERIRKSDKVASEKK